MKPEQVQLERPVCGERFVEHVCTLLHGHAGSHISSKGRAWPQAKVKA